MSIKVQIDQDLKTAMLAGNKELVTTLRGIKSAILYAEVAKGVKNTGGLSDPEVSELLTKEAKKRQDSIDMYNQGGRPEKAAAEQTEKNVIEAYLPQQMPDDELRALVESVIAESGASGMQAMGQVIGTVKAKSNGQADGGRIAAMVKECLA